MNNKRQEQILKIIPFWPKEITFGEFAKALGTSSKVAYDYLNNMPADSDIAESDYGTLTRIRRKE